jgi:hypothetical protein
VHEDLATAREAGLDELVREAVAAVS